MPEKKKEESHLDLFKKKRKAVQMLADTIEAEHHTAYQKALGLIKGAQGQIDYEKLDEENVQKGFATEMSKHYISKAKEYFHLGEGAKLDEMQADMLLLAYSGLTKKGLSDLVREQGSKFTLRQFTSIVPQFKDRIEKQLAPHAYSHIEPSHKKSVIKEMGLEGKVDPEKMTLEQLAQLLENYHGNEYQSVPERGYKNEIYHIKPKPKKEAKAA